MQVSILALLVTATTLAQALSLPPQLRFLLPATDKDGPLLSQKSVPYELCPGVEGTFQLQSVTTVPDVPQRGQRLRVEVKGHLKSAIEAGSEVSVRVKYRRIPLLTKRLNLCDELAKDGSLPDHCPIAAGDKTWVYEADIPNEIPAGQYSVDLRIRDQKQQDVTCLKVTVDF
jgi:hypothetical protein